MSRLASILAAAALVAACGDSTLPKPEILSISPTQMAASASTRATLRLDVFLPTRVDYAARTVVSDPAVEILFGDTSVGTADYQSNQTVSVPVPSVFQPGTYDVTARLQDGREAKLTRGFLIAPGQWPDGYIIDFIPEVTRQVPFDITIRASGVHAAGFNGTVTIQSSKGVIRPTVSGPFDGGTRVETVVIESANPNVTLTVQDVNGGTGTSNIFSVKP